MTADLEGHIAWGPPRRPGQSGDPARVTATFDLMSAVLEERPLEDVLTLIASHALAMAGARLAFIALPEENDANVLRIDLALGHDSDRIRGHSVRRGRSMIGRVFSTRRALSTRIAVDQTVNGLPAGPALLLPLETGEATRGVLAVIGRPGDLPLSASVTRNLSLFASMAATLVELAEERRATDRIA
ncbi:GAF domain-containing protein [Spirillospora sp. CA-294931]|uniref:GAF domain-containing protein n=1 Tax=Spirillospora sp. CA-294931 TaxID=3240042 RepID=UPI003D8A4F25